MKWHQGQLAAFDLETSGVSVENDRVVTAAVYGLGSEQPVEPHDWFVNPGIEIPAEATKLHGITTEEAHTKGEPAPGAIDHIADVLAGYARQGAAVVGHNLAYDVTLLDRELRRYDLAPLDVRLDGTPLHCIDSRVLDQHCMPYRRRVSEKQGARQLVTLAQVYGLPWDEEEAHGASYDAVVAARVVQRIGQLAHTRPRDWPEHIRTARRPQFYRLRDLTVAELHAAQIGWAAEQAASLANHFRRIGKDASGVRAEWPLVPYQPAEVTR